MTSRTPRSPSSTPDEPILADVEFPSAPDFFEAPTARSSATMRVYATVLASFDSLGDGKRVDLAEIVSLFAAAPAERQALMLAAIRAMAE